MPDFDDSFIYDKKNERPDDSTPPEEMMHYYRAFCTRRKTRYFGVTEVSVYVLRAINDKQAYQLAKELVEAEPDNFTVLSLYVEEFDLPAYRQATQIWKSERKG